MDNISIILSKIVKNKNKMIDYSKTVFIEKELLNPVNGEIVGPYFHVYTIDKEGNKTEIFVEKSGSIEKAARRAEHELDFNTLAVAYAENPNSFSSCVSASPLRSEPEIILTAEEEKQLSEIIENAKKRN